MRLDKDRPEYHRATARWDPIIGALVADSTGGQISSRLLSCRSANLLLELPRAEGTLPAGTVVSALVTGARAHTALCAPYAREREMERFRLSRLRAAWLWLSRAVIP